MSNHQAFEHLFCSIVIFLLDISHSLVHHHLTIFPFKLQSFFIIGNGSVEIFHTLPGNTSSIIGLSQKRIPFEASRTIFFRTLEIIQTDFSDSTEEIRLSQPWFGTNHLIEILDRKYIIFEIQSIAPDS